MNSHRRYLFAAIAALAAGASAASYRLITRGVADPLNVPIEAWLLLIAKAALLFPVWQGYNHLARLHRDGWLAKTAEAAFIGFAIGDGLVIATLKPDLPWEVIGVLGVVLLCIVLRVLLQLAGDLFGPAVGMSMFLIAFVLAGVGTMVGGARFVLQALLVLAGLLLLGLTLCFYGRLVELRRYLGPFALAVGILGIMQLGVLAIDMYRPADWARPAPELTAAVAPALWFSHAALMFQLYRKPQRGPAGLPESARG